MPRVVEVQGDYKILSTSRDFIVINTGMSYENHAHFKSLETLKHLLRLIEIGKAPTSPYMVKAAKRLLGDDFHELLPPRKKQNYYNHNPKATRRVG